ncbi:unnamed protein product, partial [Mesorhabditis spiculigera]
MIIKIRGCSGKRKKMEVSETDTVWYILHQTAKLRAHTSELFYKGKKLEKFCTLAYYKVSDGDQLQIVDRNSENCTIT